MVSLARNPIVIEVPIVNPDNEFDEDLNNEFVMLCGNDNVFYYCNNSSGNSNEGRYLM